MRYLALDIGSVRIGLAISDKDGRIATPLAVLSAQEVMQQAPSFRRILEDWQPEHIVAGLPKTLAGDEGAQAQSIKEQATDLANALQLPITFVDERLSSKEAKHVLAEGGLSQRQMRGKVDKVAAALFLQSFLDSGMKEQSHQRPAIQPAKHPATKSPKHHTKQNRPSAHIRNTATTLKTSPRLHYILAAIIALIVVTFAISLAFCHHKAHQTGDVVTVEIAKGAGGDAIAQELLDANLIDDARQYYTAASNLNATKSIQSGTYEFTVGTSIDDIVRQLMAGPNTKTNRLTIPEGSTVKQTAAAVQSSLGISANDFIAEAKASNFEATFDFLHDAAQTEQNSLEGYLWPSTYDFTGERVSAKSIITRMLEEFQTQTKGINWDEARNRVQQQYGLEFSNYDFIKMASLIQKEATVENDRPLVSSVFYNRLASQMALQSDATMAYSLGHEPSAEDLKQEDAYNTYLNQALPPTPICSPSAEFIEAALNPATTDYYFFLIIDNPNYTTHTFSRTYEEHLQAIQEANAAQE